VVKVLDLLAKHHGTCGRREFARFRVNLFSAGTISIPVSGTKLFSFSELLLMEICFTFDRRYV